VESLSLFYSPSSSLGSNEIAVSRSGTIMLSDRAFNGSEMLAIAGTLAYRVGLVDEHLTVEFRELGATV
jgi:hypothetical protein